MDTGQVLPIFKKANGVGVMTNLMLPLKPGYPDMEIKEHQRIVFHMAETIKDGLTAFVLTNITLFVRVISVSKIQHLCNRFISPSIYNNGCSMINNAYFSYDIAIMICHFLIFLHIFRFTQLAFFTLCKTKTSIGDIYKNNNVNLKGKNSVKNISTFHTTD